MTACLFRVEAGVERGRGEGGGGVRGISRSGLVGRSVGLGASLLFLGVRVCLPSLLLFPWNEPSVAPSSSSTPRRRRVPDKEEGWPCSVGFPLVV